MGAIWRCEGELIWVEEGCLEKELNRIQRVVIDREPLGLVEAVHNVLRRQASRRRGEAHRG